MNSLLELYWTFVKIGCVTFGGGYAMLPILERELVDKRGRTTMDDLRDYFSIGQCTPGVIAVNTATYVGYRRRGVIGGIVTTLGVITPSLIIITLIGALLARYMDNAYVVKAFAGIRVAVSALITASVTKLFKKNVKDVWGIALCVLAFLFVAILGASPVYVTVGSALFGFIMGKAGVKHD